MAERLQLDSGILLDARGAAWFADDGILAVSDLNFGFIPTGGLRGASGSVVAPDDLAFRLADLLADYRPIKTVVFGDLVYGSGESPAIENAVRTLVATVACYGTMVVVTPHPEARLEGLRRRWSLTVDATPVFEAGRLSFVSGAETVGGGEFRVIGNECPAVTVGALAAPGQRIPCFVVTPTRLFLPAFSPRGDGNDVRAARLAAALASEAKEAQAVAVLGQRLVSLPLTPVGA